MILANENPVSVHSLSYGVEYRIWCAENLPPDKDGEQRWCWYPDPYLYMITMVFKHPEDAVLFKLTFAEHLA